VPDMVDEGRMSEISRASSGRWGNRPSAARSTSPCRCVARSRTTASAPRQEAASSAPPGAVRPEGRWCARNPARASATEPGGQPAVPRRRARHEAIRSPTPPPRPRPRLPRALSQRSRRRSASVSRQRFLSIQEAGAMRAHRSIKPASISGRDNRRTLALEVGHRPRGTTPSFAAKDRPSTGLYATLAALDRAGPLLGGAAAARPDASRARRGIVRDGDERGRRTESTTFCHELRMGPSLIINGT
jgi:hypothetical protein